MASDSCCSAHSKFIYSSQRMSLFLTLIIFIPFINSLFIRPPSVPIIVQDPYISLWSPHNNLYDGSITHWNGGLIQFTGFIIIDNICYRWMGKDDFAQCPNTMNQVSLNINALSTDYSFNDPSNKVQLNISFITPSILNATKSSLLTDIEWLSLPITFLKFKIKSTDKMSHNVALYFDIFGELPAVSFSEYLQWNMDKLYDNETNSDFVFFKMGTTTQIFNNDSGNDRIDWGFMHFGVNSTDSLNGFTINNSSLARNMFIISNGTKLPNIDLTSQPRLVNDNYPSLIFSRYNHQISANDIEQFEWIFGYDEINSIEYFGTLFEPNWKKLLNCNGDLNQLMLTLYIQRYSIFNEVDNKNMEIYNDLSSKYGDKYALVCTLSYRQITGGMKIIYNERIDKEWIFIKEISSDGDIDTVDVIYPFSPFLLYYNPKLLISLMEPLLIYSNNQTYFYGNPVYYNLNWAPHHLGHYPVCNLLPQNQEQMPVEETGNFFLVITAIIQYQYKQTGQYDLEWISNYWKLFEIWGQFLISNLPAPPRQLCTDDFEGAMANNSNLAIKGIIGLYAYGLLLEYNGNNTGSDYYKNMAMNYAKIWLQLAIDDDKTHYKYQYNKTDTWSLKYNLCYQRVLGIDYNVLFNESVFDLEMNYYDKLMLDYGIALNTGVNYTIIYDELWISSLGDMTQFNVIMDRVFNFVNSTPDRVPLSDWYYVNNGKRVGFEARPTIGGFWMPMLISPKS